MTRFEQAARAAGWRLAHVTVENRYRFFHDDGRCANALPHDWEALCKEAHIKCET